MEQEIVRCPELQDKIIEDLQEAIIQAGGRFFRKQELLSLSFFEILNGFVPNNIEFKFEYVKPPKSVHRTMSMKEAIDEYKEDPNFIKSL